MMMMMRRRRRRWSRRRILVGWSAPRTVPSVGYLWTATHSRVDDDDDDVEEEEVE